MNDQKCKRNGISGMHIILNVSQTVRRNERRIRDAVYDVLWSTDVIYNLLRIQTSTKPIV